MARKTKSKRPAGAPQARRSAGHAAAAGPTQVSPSPSPPQQHPFAELQQRVAAAVASKEFETLIEIGGLPAESVIEAGDKNVAAWLCMVKIHGLAGDPELEDYKRFTTENKPALLAEFQKFIDIGPDLVGRPELEWYLQLHGYGPKAEAARLPWLKRLREGEPAELFHVERLRGAILTLMDQSAWSDEVQLLPDEMEKLGDLDAIMLEAFEAAAEQPDLSEIDRLTLRVLSVDFDLRRAEPWDQRHAMARITKLPQPVVDAIRDPKAMTPLAWAFLCELQQKANPEHLLQTYPANMGTLTANAIRMIASSLVAPAQERDRLLLQGLGMIAHCHDDGRFVPGNAVCVQGVSGPVVVEPRFQGIKVPNVTDCLALLLELAPADYARARELLIAWKIREVTETYLELEADDQFAAGLLDDPALIWLCANVPEFGRRAANILPDLSDRAIAGLRYLSALIHTRADSVSEHDGIYLEEFKATAAAIPRILQLLDEIGEQREAMSESVHRLWLQTIPEVFRSLLQKLPKPTEQLVLERARRFHDDLIDAGEAFTLGYLEQIAGDRVDAACHYLFVLQHAEEGNSSVEGNLRILLKAVDTEGEAEELAQLIAGADFPSSREQVRKQLFSLAKAKGEELSKKEQFERTAVNRWPSITQPARKLLGVLASVKKFASYEELGQYASMEVDWVRRHYKKLIETGMIFETTDTFRVNPHILPLIERENLHTVIGRIVRSTGTSAVKQVFNSNREFSIYQILVQLCPNHLVFPNCGLQSFMAFDRMKELVAEADFGYYLRASVDILVVSSTTFLPMLAIEVDSPWHDTEKQTERDGRKDRLFAAAGVPFLRLQPVGSPSENVIRGQVSAHVDELVRTLRADLPGYDQARQLLQDLADAAPPAGPLPSAPG